MGISSHQGQLPSVGTNAHIFIHAGQMLCVTRGSSRGSLKPITRLHHAQIRIIYCPSMMRRVCLTACHPSGPFRSQGGV